MARRKEKATSDGLFAGAQFAAAHWTARSLTGHRPELTFPAKEARMRTLWTMMALGFLILPACKGGGGGVEMQTLDTPPKAEHKQTEERAPETQKKAGDAQQSAAAPASGEVSGRIARATSSEVHLANHPQPLKVDSSTHVTLDGRTVSVEQLPAGTEVRASFKMDSGVARATRIEATSK